ncbi:hypothetical protein GGU11DRAFT_803239 [Lentinula aff. detonsa]|nr:hypothetical protein GGU11DRAFT_803239 [Lentinula aff. detonsa]
MSIRSSDTKFQTQKGRSTHSDNSTAGHLREVSLVWQSARIPSVPRNLLELRIVVNTALFQYIEFSLSKDPVADRFFTTSICTFFFSSLSPVCLSMAFPMPSAQGHHVSIFADPSMFIDDMSRAMGLKTAQNSDLQASAKIGESLDRPSLYLHLVTQAQIFKLQNTIEQVAENEANLTQLVTELRSQSVESWSPNEAQKVCISRVVKETLANPLRSSYAHVYDDSMKKLESKQRHYYLESVFKSETRRKVLNSYVHIKVNNNKGALRRLVLASVRAVLPRRG